jgi:hypothetical protein
MKALQVVAERSSGAARRGVRQSGSLLPASIDRALGAAEDAGQAGHDSVTALRNTIEAIWRIVKRQASDRPLDRSRHSAGELLARRELVQRGICILSAVIRRGVESGAFRPPCVSWAIERLPVAIVRGACVQWVFGLSKRPSVGAGTAVAAALEILRAETYNLEGKTLP